MSSSEELEEYKAQLAVVEDGLSEDPDNENLLNLKQELSDLIGLLDNTGNKDSNDDSSNVSKKEERSPADETFDKVVTDENSRYSEGQNQAFSTNHSDNRSQTSRADTTSISPPPYSSTQGNKNEQVKTRFKTGDAVLAKWLSGDKQYHQAKVTLVTGSVSNPRYTVRFPKHNVTETLTPDYVRSESSNNTSRSQAARQPIPNALPQDTKSKAPSTDKVAKPEKTTATKVRHQPSKAQVLDSGKQKWQEFTKKGIKQGKGIKPKKLGEDSMFRSPQDLSSKVGVVSNSKSKKSQQKSMFDSTTRLG